MKIHVAGSSGFCFGVKRAMEFAYDYAEKNREGKIYSLREIIHNPQEVRRLVKAGAKHVESIEKVKSESSVIVSTHGITPEEEEALKKKRLKILDMTCPYVKRIHRIAKKLSQEGYQVIIAGDKKHLEVKGILGYTNSRGIVINSPAEALKIRPGNKIGIISQTTQNVDAYREIIDAVIKKAYRKRYIEVRAYNTICDATQKRQDAAMALAGKVDVMIIVGGRNSANTRRLYELSKKRIKNVYFIESERELKKEWFKNAEDTGISAGASTPERVIRKVAAEIKRITAKKQPDGRKKQRGHKKRGVN